MSHRPISPSRFRPFRLLRYALLVNIGLIMSSAVAWAAAAQIKTITPACAATGSRVSITGTGFGSHNVQITVGATPATVSTATGNQATFLVPPSVPSGLTTVTATNPGQ